MRISIITLFPKMIEGFFNESIIKRAIEKNLINIQIIDLRKFSINSYGSVDDRPYGGGAGMVLQIEPLYEAISKVKTKSAKIVLTSAKGKQFNQKKAKQYSKLEHLILIAGHYEGVDERVLQYVDEEISLGDFVLTGGEIVVAAIADSIVRLIPGVLKKESATKLESFFEVSVDQLLKIVGNNELLLNLQKRGIKKIKLLEYSQYTRPDNFLDQKVPDILLSGKHKEIEEWRLKNAFETTLKNRKDLLK